MKKSSINNTLPILLILLFCLSAFAQTNEIKCVLSFNDRMLDVEIEVPENSLDKTSFGLTDEGGQNNYASNIYRVTAKDEKGNRLNVVKSDARTWTISNLKKPFKLSYSVVSQKENFMGGGVRNHFHPSIFKNYAFLWGTSFLFYPENEKLASMPVKLQIIPNEYKNYYTNFEGKADSYHELEQFFVAAGDYRVVEKNIGERSVKFLLQGKDWKFTDAQFADTVSRIIEAQVRYIGFAPSKENLLITLTEGTPDSRGGTVVKNVISVYPNPQAGIDDLETLKFIAHENFHSWNGSYWHGSSDKKEGYYKWMSEGFTEYYSGLTLFRENLITEKQFVAWLNKLLLDYQTNPHAKSATAEILAEKYWESQDYNQLPYYKGALVAFLTDLKIRQKTNGKKQIDDLMRILISKTDLIKGYDDQILLGGFDDILQDKNEQFYKDYMLGSHILPIVEVLKKSGILTAEREREIFDFGFSLENGKFERGAKIKEVTTQNAVEAGIKPGDILFAFSFNHEKPNEKASITVQRNGENLSMKYFPMKTVKILEIDENAKIPR